MNLPTSTIAPKTRLAKYREVEKVLRQEIDAGLWRAGDRLPGEYDLAERFGVSYLTMRQAIACLVHEGMLLRVRGKGTFIVDRTQNDVLQATTTHPMALVFPTNWQRRDPYYFPEVLEGFQREMEARGHQTPLVHDNVAGTPGVLPPGSAVACLLSDDVHLQLVEQLRDQGHLVLGINRYTGRRVVPSVRIDDPYGVEQVVEYLVSLNHRRISFVCGPSINFDAIGRLQGFRSAVKRFGLKHANEAGDDYSEASGYAAAQMLLSLPSPPTAIVCASDLSAIGVMRAAGDLHVNIPNDLSVVGYGDFPVAHYVRPSLTTIRQDRLSLGQSAAQSLVRLANDETVQDVVLTPSLILRESTAQNGQ